MLGIKRRKSIVSVLLPGVLMLLGPVLFINCSPTTEAAEDIFSFTGVEKLTVIGSFFDVDVTGHSQGSVEVEVTIPERLRKRGVTVYR